MAEDRKDRERILLLNQIEEMQQKILQIEKDSVLTEADKLKKTIEYEKALVRMGKALQKINKSRNDSLKSEEIANTNLSDIYAGLSKMEQSRLINTMKSKTLTDSQTEQLGRMAEINRELAQISINDVIQREALSDEFKNIETSLGELNEADKSILTNLQKQFEVAGKYADLTESQKKQLEAQIEVYNDIKKAIGGILDTAGILLGSPAGFFGTTLIGAGKFVGKLGEVRSQLGGLYELSTTGLSFFDDNAVENAKTLSNEFGGINNVSGELQASTSLISANMGISGQEAAGLLGSFARLNSMSGDTALDLVTSTQEFAKQNGIIPSDLLADLAGSAEEFALFGKQGGKNLIEAGAAARKMGVSIKTMTGVAENLLDFENSINKEMELGALMGRNINLDRARALAYEGKITEATEETLRTLGGVDAFNKMDYFQKKATAELLGTSVDELQKMVTQQENAATVGGQINEKFSLMGQTIDGVLNKYLGTSLEGLGGMVIAAGQLGTGFSALGGPLGGIYEKIKGLGGAAAESVADAAEESVASKLTDTVKDKASSKAEDFVDSKIDSLVSPEATESINKDKSMGDKLKDLAKGLRAMGDTKVLFGAFNLIPTALGFVSILPGIPGIIAIGTFGALAGEGLKKLGKGLAVFGQTKGLLSGLLMLAGLGLALMPLTYALSLLAPLVESIGKAIGSVVESIGKGISMVVGSISDLLVNVLPLLNLEAAAGIVAMAGAFTLLAGSLALLGTVGMAAIPVLLAVGAVGGIAAGLFGGEEGGAGGEGQTSKTDELINEIKGLRADLASGKIAVYMDGKKVTSGVAKVVNTSSTNSYVPK